MMHPERQRWIEDGRTAKTIERLCADRGLNLKKIAANELAGSCPKCGGTDRFSINTKDQVFNCRGCAKGGKGPIDLTMFIDGTELDAAVEKLTGKPPPKTERPVENGRWVYRDAENHPYLCVRRFDDKEGNKKYFQYHWDGQWLKNKPAGPKIPYRLPELIDSDRSEPVYICEGEKCADAVAGLGLTATSASEGAGKWTPDLNEWFRDRIAYIVPDNDAPGRNHARLVAQNLAGIARDIRIVVLPHLGDREDAVEWIKRGGNRDQLDLIGEAAPQWMPAESGIIQGPNGLQEAYPSIDIKVTFTFLGEAPPSPPKELIKGHLPAYGVAVTGGQSSAGKTFVKIHKAICLATGAPYFGRRIVEKVGTAFVAAEGRAIIPNRFAAALTKADVTGKLPIAWIKQLPDFSNPAGIKLFEQQLIELDKRFRGDFGMRLGMVPIDTVAACFSMKDEDDNAEATKVSNVMRSIGETTGALMAPVHHFGKNPESGLRGASAWRGSADVVEGVLADLDPLTGRASNRELVCIKARDGEQGPISPFELEFVQLGHDTDGEPYGSCAVVPITGQSRFDKTASLSKGQKALQDAITEALDRNGKNIEPRAGMGLVKAVKVTDVRIEFDRRYVTDQSDQDKAYDAKRMAFKRSLDRLPSSQFGAGSAEGADWIWRTT